MAKKGKLDLNQVDTIQEMPLEKIKGAVRSRQEQLQAMMVQPQMQQALSQEAEQKKQEEEVAADDSPEARNARIDSYIKAHLDPATLESRAEYANGSAPSTAINKSPLGLMDRMKMSIGDERGNLNFLKSNFEDVQKMRSGAMAVKNKDGLWYQVDPNGAGSGDAWERSKEIAKDILGDGAGMIGTAAAVTGATLAAIPSGGASLAAIPLLVGAGAAGAGAAMVRTSLGRMVGTYDATPEEQLKDIALETVLNVGGQVIGLGVKPTAQYLGRSLMAAGDKLKVIPDASKKMISKVFGAVSGVGEDNYDIMLNNTKQVGEAMVGAGKGVSDSASVITNLTQQNIQHTKSIAKETRSALTSFYQTQMDDITKVAGDGFKPQVASAVNNTFKEYAEQGFGEIAKDGKFLLKDRSKIGSMLAEQGKISALSDEAGYNIVNKYVSFVNDVVAGQKDLSGKAAVSQYISLEQKLGQKVRELTLEAAEAGGSDVIKTIKGVNAGILNKVNDAASKSLGSDELINKFAGLQSKYSSYKDSLAPILDAETRFRRSGSSEAFNSLYDNLFKNANLTTKSTGAKNALGVVLNDLGQHAPNITKLSKEIAVNKAAAAFMPSLRPGLLGQTAAVGSVASLNPAAIAAATTTSPRLNFEAAKLAGSMFKGMDFMKGLPAPQRLALVSDPKMLQGFISTVISAPASEKQIKDQLVNSVGGAVGAQANGQ